MHKKTSAYESRGSNKSNSSIEATVTTSKFYFINFSIKNRDSFKKVASLSYFLIYTLIGRAVSITSNGIAESLRMLRMPSNG